jgi:acylphosphatase
MLELHATFFGEVQAVGFRATACTFAQQLGLTGIVRNKRDESVEIVAQGKKEHLEKLVDKLKKTFDQIEDIEIEYRDSKTPYEDFSISL